MKNAKKSGFETAITISADYQFFKVEALDADGEVIGTSKTVTAT